MRKNANKYATQNLTALLLLVFLLSCVQNPNISGKWQEPGKTSSIEFRQNGTFVAIDDMGMTVNGNYTFLDEGKIRLEINDPNSYIEIIIGSIEVQGDKLKLSQDGGKGVLLYQRIE